MSGGMQAVMTAVRRPRRTERDVLADLFSTVNMALATGDEGRKNRVTELCAEWFIVKRLDVSIKQDGDSSAFVEFTV